MRRLTISEARAVFEEQVLPQVNDHQAREARSILEAAEKQAQSFAAEYISDREREVRESRDQALRELTEVRDSLDDLRVEGGTGRVSAREYADRLEALHRRQEAAEAAMEEAQDKVSLIEQIETDPITFYDEMAERFEHMKVEVPW
jgi:hypothetical protein